jgi:tetratricopeptide (TPR) repeat protein
MTWTTKSEKALQLAHQGATHLMNIENALAYEKFKQALDLDPNFTVVLTLISGLTRGDTQKRYADRALKSALYKTTGEKIFVNTVKPDPDGKIFQEVTTKLHGMFPDGRMVGLFYVFSRATPDEQFKACQDYLKKFPDEACGYNMLGYLNMQVKKDTAAAKTCFEKYIKLYPDGYNPYDSMGEWYFDAGDLANAEKYYNMALEKYPFNISSINKLTEIKQMKDKKMATK